MKIKVLVYDDNERFSKRYKERIDKVKVPGHTLDADAIGVEDFAKELKELSKRQDSLRESKSHHDEPTADGGLTIDKTDVFVVDYDLVKTFPSEGFLTGEQVSYAARCFSACKLIMGLNQYGHNTFDLTLKGHPESWADVNIGEKQLDNRALWGGDSDFRPWYWQHIPKYLEAYTARVEHVGKNLDVKLPILLGIENEAKTLPKGSLEFFGGDFSRMNAKNFATESGNGLRGRDKHATPGMVARITAARLSKWLERELLPGQDILVDAPHLVSRFPSLLTDEPTIRDSWNRTARFADARRVGIDAKRIEDFEFKNDFWLSRAVWHSKQLTNFTKISEVKTPWVKKSPKFVFAEDASKFYRENECRQFLASLDSPYVRRYVRFYGKNEVDYSPRARML